MEMTIPLDTLYKRLFRDSWPRETENKLVFIAVNTQRSVDYKTQGIKMFLKMADRHNIISKELYEYYASLGKTPKDYQKQEVLNAIVTAINAYTGGYAKPVPLEEITPSLRSRVNVRPVVFLPQEFSSLPPPGPSGISPSGEVIDYYVDYNFHEHPTIMDVVGPLRD